ncbi:sugar transferase [Candidatus Saccharibacteria bacterium]|nr:sugar transferase [Candidatus Saccharibacteria bacterium]
MLLRILTHCARGKGKQKLEGKGWRNNPVKTITNASNNGLSESRFTGSFEARAAQIGALPRRAGLDEIPQFLNVLNGAMALVVPRPVTKQAKVNYRDAVPDVCHEWNRCLKIAKPG